MIKKLALLLISLAVPAWGQATYARYDFSLTNAQGQAISGASAYLLTQPANTSSLTPLATIYANNTGAGGPIPNPVTTDGFGHAFAYATPGLYTVCYVSPYTGTICYADQNLFLGGNNGISPSTQFTIPCYSSGGVAIQGCGATVSSSILNAPSGGFSGNLAGNVTGNVTGHASQDLALSGGALTGALGGPEFNNVFIAGSSSYPTIHAAVAAAIAASTTGNVFGGWTAFVPCGNYSDNIDITVGMRLVGENMSCVSITPANPALPVITIDASSVAAILYVSLENLTLTCPPTTTCNDGIQIKGNGTNQPNDGHYIHNVNIGSVAAPNATYGFLNGLDILGRTIDDTIDTLLVGNTRGNGLNIINTYGPVNNLLVLNSSFHDNWNYGMYMNQNGISTASTDLTFMNDTFQNDGANTALTDCAGVYLNTFGGITFKNNYFENNCPSNGNTAKIAHIRATATFAQALNVRENLFNSPNNEWSIYDDATESTGMWDGNYVIAAGRGFNVATNHPASQIFIGTNFGFNAPTITLGSGNTYVAGPVFSGTFTTTSATSESVSLVGCSANSHAWVEATNSTAAALTGVYVSAPVNNGFTLNHSATSGGIFNTFCTPN